MQDQAIQSANIHHHQIEQNEEALPMDVDSEEEIMKETR